MSVLFSKSVALDSIIHPTRKQKAPSRVLFAFYRYTLCRERLLTKSAGVCYDEIADETEFSQKRRQRNEMLRFEEGASLSC